VERDNGSQRRASGIASKSVDRWQNIELWCSVQYISVLFYSFYCCFSLNKMIFWFSYLPKFTCIYCANKFDL
jgi:hypothetical protein